MGPTNKRPQGAEDEDEGGKPHKAMEPDELDLVPEPPPRAGRNPVSFPADTLDVNFRPLVTKHVAPNEFEHEPLSEDKEKDQIRLLILEPVHPGRTIHCSFLVCSLSDPRTKFKYEALSYYWGTEKDDCEIRIRTHTPRILPSKSKSRLKHTRNQIRPAKFHIRPRLHDALMQLRTTSQPLYLWIDALCIDQDNEVEKTQQVQKMARIYNTAKRVLIWLGAGNERCEEGLYFTEEILNLASFDARIKDEKSPPKWAALVELMRQDWFSRRWVIQELAHAREATLLYNDKEMDWSLFADAVAIFATRFNDIKHLFLNSRYFEHNAEYLGDLQALGANILVEVITNHFRRSPDGLERLASLEVLVSRLLKFESSDPKDTVYALLSIYKGKDGSEEELVPDYEKSVIEVYRDFTRYCVVTSRSIDIICRHWAPSGWSKSATVSDSRLSRKKDEREKRKVNAKMPSWVPLLTDSPFGAPGQVPPGRVNGDSLVGHPDRKCYDACGGKFEEVRFENIPLVIKPAEGALSVSETQGDRPPVPLADASGLSQSQLTAEGIDTGQQDSCDPRDSNSTYSASSSESAQSAETETLRDRSQESPLINAFFMFVTGIHIDTVTEVSAQSPPWLLTKEGLKMGGWSGRGDAQQYDIPEALWRTLTADRSPEGGKAPTYYRRACWDSLHRTNSSGYIDMANLIIHPGTPSITKDFLRRVQSIVWNRLFVRSRQRDLFGLGPKGTKLGDLICILYGCSVPVILRAQKDPHGLEFSHYDIVGECYIYGMMDGEAISKIEPETGTTEFKLG